MKTKKNIIVSIALLFVTFFNAQEPTAKDKKSWYTPDYVKMQFGGNIGFVSLGVGYEVFENVLFSELLYGYVPKSVSQADRIHLITIKNTFPIFKKEIGKNLTLSPIAGFAATLDIGTNTFTTLPSKYPEGYYVPTAIHFTLYAGASVHQNFKNTKIFKGADFYFEVGTVESYLWYAITTKEVKMKDIFSFDVGVNFYL
ncbi:hypothetical protein H9W90_03105 [Polaribacter pectinis]|uniref:Outer membrane protein beta-barrel domain-containing protein n=1 Tax=Polaribacter pectinis TaxID=2738844 RepID=A0A7G9LBX1_9FLAO|nr:hypothetical protein [Polaribacter pectinis]QNM86120.1 hypothetical protein H9W90_03105 [Polaribacter pectinis]